MLHETFQFAGIEQLGRAGRTLRDTELARRAKPEDPAITSAFGIDFGVIPGQTANAQTIDDLIKQSQPAAESILTSGTGSAIDFATSGAASAEDRLRGFLRPEAFEEQSALLGAKGAEAQRAAIDAIPVSAAQVEADRRETIGFNRQAAAHGELGSGNTLLGAGQVAAQQQVNRVGGRINELEQLARIDRGILSDISRQRESAGSRVSALQMGLGGQLANVGKGFAAPAVESIQTQAEIAGLRGIAGANASAQRSGQIANLAGQVFTPSNINAVAGLFNSPQSTPAVSTTQNLNFNQALA